MVFIYSLSGIFGYIYAGNECITNDGDALNIYDNYWYSVIIKLFVTISLGVHIPIVLKPLNVALNTLFNHYLSSNIQNVFLILLATTLSIFIPKVKIVFSILEVLLV